LSEELRQASDLVCAAQALVCLTGAGISAESGVPTFRGPEGMWRNYRPEDLATPEAFHADPLLVWSWYDWRRSLVAGAEPNAGHRALAVAQPRIASWLLVTQNVDGLHQRAGSRDVHELHGSLWRLRCTACGAHREDLRVPLPLPPRCPNCEALERPDVVWFGEVLPVATLRTAVDAAARAEVLLVVGTSAVVYPAASLIDIALQCEVPVIEVNPADSAASRHVRHHLRGSAAEVLPALLRL
jgi:NAD-dependent deacetylase